VLTVYFALVDDAGKYKLIMGLMDCMYD
jgi:hypothetical protein